MTDPTLIALMRGFSSSWVFNAAITQDIEALRRIVLEHGNWWNTIAWPTIIAAHNGDEVAADRAIGEVCD